jgi:hypothetical protein
MTRTALPLDVSDSDRPVGRTAKVMTSYRSELLQEGMRPLETFNLK